MYFADKIHFSVLMLTGQAHISSTVEVVLWSKTQRRRECRTLYEIEIKWCVDIGTNNNIV